MAINYKELVDVPDEVGVHIKIAGSKADKFVYKLFAQSKVEMNGKRNKTHSSSTTDGKQFIIFITAIVKTELMNKLQTHIKNRSSSLENTIAKLSNIKIATDDALKSQLVKTPTREQKIILSAFDALEEVLNIGNKRLC
ncbi:MAG: hypothetical protein LBF12_04490 [Christensenellaceae bacterium]|jgi:hypothetical protein|nr:hypothetical protein [Christensenellaceae bacterium]